MTIRLSKSIVGALEAEAVSRVIVEDGYLGMGSEVISFEAELAGYLGIPEDHAVCVNTGTSALHLAVAAVVKPGDEVLIPSLTYAASFQAAIAAGAEPVACDVLEESGVIDPDDAAKRITSRTAAIMPVYYASYLPNLERVYEFAREHGLRVIEDAAHAFGCTFKGRKIGSFGDIVCFSFDGIKNITSGEGGMIATRDENVLKYLRDARLLGVERDTEMRRQGRRSWEFDIKQIGYRYHMSNLMAAIGRVQLKRFDNEFAPKRKLLSNVYRKMLSDKPFITLFQSDSLEVVPHIFPVRILDGKRDDLRSYLEEQGVQTGIHYKPNHLLTLFGGGEERLPVVEKLYGELLTLPLHPELQAEDVERIGDMIIRRLTGKS